MIDDVERQLSEFCPELHPRTRYVDFGIEVKCDWSLRFFIDTPEQVYRAKLIMMDNIYKHIGEMTVLAHKLNNDIKK